MRVETIKCDTCGRVKSQDDWMIIGYDTESFSFGKRVGYRYDQLKDCCSQECLQKEISKFLDRLRKGK